MKKIGRLADDLNRLDSDAVMEVLCCCHPMDSAPGGVLISDLVSDFGFLLNNEVGSLVREAQDRGFKVSIHNGTKTSGRELIVSTSGWKHLNDSCEAYWAKTRKE